MEKLFDYVPINQISDVMDEREKIRSGYYLDINKQLEILKESFNVKIYEQNPFCILEHNTNEYLEFLKNQVINDCTIETLTNENQFKKQTKNCKTVAEASVIEIPSENLDNVLANMSSEDIVQIEDILNKSISDVVEDIAAPTVKPKEKLNSKENTEVIVDDNNYDFELETFNSVALTTDASDLKCLEEVDFENDPFVSGPVSYPNHNNLELGVAHTLINLHQNTFTGAQICDNEYPIFRKGDLFPNLKDFLEEFENNKIIQNEIFNTPTDQNTKVFGNFQ